MKKIILAASLLFFSTAAMQAQEVGGAASLDANIQNYQSYSWVSDIDNIPSDKMFVGPNGVLVFNNNSARSHIKEAIQYELSARGYKQASTEGDMLVTFSVLEQPARLRTYNGYQVIGLGADTVRTEDDVQWVDAAPGTLLVNLIDRKSSQTVWQGYASGIMKPEMMNDKMKVREAVSSIFQEFNHKAATASNK